MSRLIVGGLDCKIQPELPWQDPKAFDDLVVDTFRPASIRLFWIANCPIQRVPPSVVELEYMTSLRMDNTSLTSWDVEMVTLTRLFELNLKNAGNLGPDLPLGMHKIPPSCVTLYLKYVGMRNLPETLDPSWISNIMWFSLRGNGLTSFPEQLFQLKSPFFWELSESFITTLPELGNSTVEELYISRNRITEIPPNFFERFPALKMLTLDHNEIADLSQVAVPTNNSLFTLEHNPVCNDTNTQWNGYAICNVARFKECAPGCHVYLLGNNDCNPKCNVQACDHDGRDCTYLQRSIL